MPNLFLIGIFALLLVAAACKQGTLSDIASLPTEDWIEAQVKTERLPALPGFTMKVPSGWYVDHHPSDTVSFGTIYGNEARIRFWYMQGANGPSPSEFQENEYSVAFETVNGARVRLMEIKTNRYDRTVALFKDIHGDSSQIGLVIDGSKLTEENQRYLITIVRSVRGLNADSETAKSLTPTPLSGAITDWQGRSISYEDAKYVLADSISRVVTITDAFKERERCLALNPHWSELKEEKIPDSLLNALMAEFRRLPMPVYEANDALDARNKCEQRYDSRYERRYAQYIRVSPINLTELNEGRIFVRIVESIGSGGSSWEYTFELRDGHWVRVGGRSLGMS